MTEQQLLEQERACGFAASSLADTARFAEASAALARRTEPPPVRGRRE